MAHQEAKFAPIKNSTSVVTIDKVSEEKTGNYGPYRIVNCSVGGKRFVWMVGDKIYSRYDLLFKEGFVLDVSANENGFVKVEMHGKDNDISTAIKEHQEPVKQTQSKEEHKEHAKPTATRQDKSFWLSYGKDAIVAGVLKWNQLPAFLKACELYTITDIMPSWDFESLQEDDGKIDNDKGKLLGSKATKEEVKSFIETIRALADKYGLTGDKRLAIVEDKLALLFDLYMEKETHAVFTLKSRDAAGVEGLVSSQDSAFIKWASKELESELT